MAEARFTLGDCVRALCAKPDALESVILAINDSASHLFAHAKEEDAFYDALVLLTSHYLAHRKGPSSSPARELKRTLLTYALTVVKSSEASPSALTQFLTVIGSLVRPDVFCLENANEIKEKLSTYPIPSTAVAVATKKSADSLPVTEETTPGVAAPATATATAATGNLGDLFTRYRAVPTSTTLLTDRPTASASASMRNQEDDDLVDELRRLDGDEVILKAMARLPEVTSFLELLSDSVATLFEEERVDVKIIESFLERAIFVKNVTTLWTSLVSKGVKDDNEPRRIAAASALAAALYSTYGADRLACSSNKYVALEAALQIPMTVASVLGSKALGGLRLALCLIYKRGLEILINGCPAEKNLYALNASVGALALSLLKTIVLLFENLQTESITVRATDMPLAQLIDSTSLHPENVKSFYELVHTLSVSAFDAAVTARTKRGSLIEPPTPSPPPLPPRALTTTTTANKSSLFQMLIDIESALTNGGGGDDGGGGGDILDGDQESGLREMFEGTSRDGGGNESDSSSTDLSLPPPPPPLPPRDWPPKRAVGASDEKDVEGKFSYTAEIFMDLACFGFCFLNDFVAMSGGGSSMVTELSREFFNGSSFFEGIVHLIKKLDKKVDIPESLPSLVNFSNSIGRLLQSLITKKIWRKDSCVSALARLGMNLMTESPRDADWRLCPTPRALGILAHHLISLQQDHGETMPGKAEPSCRLAWERLISTLKKSICDHPVDEKLFEDLSVEHVQLFQLLFEHFGVEDRRDLICHFAVPTLIEFAKSANLGMVFPLLPARLLLIVDYMLLSLTTALSEHSVLDLVGINLFKPGSVSGLMPAVGKHDDAENVQYFHFLDEMESDYVQAVDSASDKGGGSGWVVNPVSPFFYDLHPEVEILNSEVSLLLGSTYPTLYQSVVSLLLCGSFSPHLFKDSLTGAQTSQSVCYCFSTAWRILEMLIPPLEFLKTVSDLPSYRVEKASDLCMLFVALDIIHKMRRNHWTLDVLLSPLDSSASPEETASATSLVENLIKKAKDTINCLSLFQHILEELYDFGLEYFRSPSSLPPVAYLICVDAVLTSYHILLDEIYSQDGKPSENDDQLDEIRQTTQKTLPIVLNHLTLLAKVARAYLVGGSGLTKIEMKFSTCDAAESDLDSTAQVLMKALSVGKVNRLSSEQLTVSKLPEKLTEALTAWDDVSQMDLLALVDQFSEEERQQKSVFLIRSLLLAYNTDVVVCSKYYYCSALRHLMGYCTRVTDDLLRWCFKETENEMKDVVAKTLLPLTIDATTGFVCKKYQNLFDLVLGSDSSDVYRTALLKELLARSDELMLTRDVHLSPYAEDILADTAELFSNMLDKASTGGALMQFFKQEDRNVVEILMTASLPSVSATYRTKLLKFFNKLLAQNESSPDVFNAFEKLDQVEESRLRSWLKAMLAAGEKDAGAKGSCHEQLATFISSLFKHESPVSETVSSKLLDGFISLGPFGEFGNLLPSCIHLAGYKSGESHTRLFAAAVKWLTLCKPPPSSGGEEKTDTTLPTRLVADLLKYVADIMIALKCVSGKQGQGKQQFAESDNGDLSFQDLDSDCADDAYGDDLGDDSATEESDGEDALCNQLCTFTVTQKEFMHQHWYHCHTCNMVDGMGVCTICAKVCHRDHDLSYAKCGSFFCDCGAKEDSSCKALVRRLPGGDAKTQKKTTSSQAKPLGKTVKSESRKEERANQSYHRRTKRRRSVESVVIPPDLIQLGNQIKTYEEDLQGIVNEFSLPTISLDFIDQLLPSLVKVSQRNQAESGIGYGLRELEKLHRDDKEVEMVDNLTTATLSSQDGAFENVKLSYSGEQGQVAKRFIGANVLARVAMCALGSPRGKKQFLLICHDKGKLTLLLLSSLLKQAESSKKKLTLARLSSSSVPFTVITAASNPCNDECVALCGLQECQVLTFNSSGAVSDHLVLHPSLDQGKCILKPIWLPGSQTQLAIVTVDFIKIYDLSVDAISPAYYFLLPSEKIRDATFICSDKSQMLVVMTVEGHLYIQPMDKSNSANHGPFYLTVQLIVEHANLKETNGTVAEGGLSVHYSHGLQLLFFSYAKEFSYAASLDENSNAISKLFPIEFKSGSRNSAGLTDWSDVRNHPGLLMCLTHPSGLPVMVLVEPNKISLQEFKNMPAKSKVLGMISIRHGSGAQLANYRTTTIVLSDDGSLRIYLANNGRTNHWLSPSFRPAHPLADVRTVGRRRAIRARQKAVRHVRLPVDHFENCQTLSDVEFGGKDILHVYNSQQVKVRLNTQGTYLACTKPTGFDLVVVNLSSSSVIVGVRVQVGGQSVDKAPSYFEVFGRQMTTSVTRSRWYDLPFTREEMQTVAVEKKFTLKVGPSHDANNITMIDSVKVYGKAKDECGWLNETVDDAESRSDSASALALAGEQEYDAGNGSGVGDASLDDKMVASCLQILDGCFSDGNRDQTAFEEKCYAFATQLLTASTVPIVHAQTKALLAAFYSSRQDYHQHKDCAQLAQVFHLLRDTSKLDVESFQKALALARGVGIARPANLHRIVVNREVGGDEETTPVDAAWFVETLVSVFWSFYAKRSINAALTPICNPGITRVDTTVTALVEILNALVNASSSILPQVAPHYLKMLLCEDPNVSSTCYHALVYALRPRKRRKAPPPPTSLSPAQAAAASSTPVSKPPEKKKKEKRPPSSKERSERKQERRVVRRRVGGPAMALPPSMAAMMNNPESVEAVMAGFSGVRRPPPRSAALEHMLHVAGMVDDDAMMELAIQLSLQEQGSSPPAQQVQRGSAEARENSGQSAVQQAQGESVSPEEFDDSLSQSTLSGSEHEPQADVAARAAQPDEEMLEFVEDPPDDLIHGEELFGDLPEDVIGVLDDMDVDHELVLPAVAAGGGGSGENASVVSPEREIEEEKTAESSVVDDGEALLSLPLSDDRESAPLAMPDDETDRNDDQIVAVNARLKSQRIDLLRILLHHVSELREIGGVKSVPYFQVILYLCSLLGTDDEDVTVANELIVCLIRELNFGEENSKDIFVRTSWRENQVLVWRLLSVLMSKDKPTESQKMIQSAVCGALLNEKTIPYCLNALTSLLDYWRKNAESNESTSVPVPGALLKPRLAYALPDFSPFFVRQYVLGHAKDIFECYPLLITELLLRISYQIRKLSAVARGGGAGGESQPKATFGSKWKNCLAQYMLVHQSVQVRRQVRKLLLSLSGSKEKYRELRDLHLLAHHVQSVRSLCSQGGYDASCVEPIPLALPYDGLLTFYEHVKACSDVAVTRTASWQLFCEQENTVLSFFLRVSLLVPEGIVGQIFQLLTSAVCGVPGTAASGAKGAGTKYKKDRKSESVASQQPPLTAVQLKKCQTLADQLTTSVNLQLLTAFVRLFLLESNNSRIRWQTHLFLTTLNKLGSDSQRARLTELLWSLWPDLPSYGRKAGQFVDLLSCFIASKSDQVSEAQTHSERAVQLLKTQNSLLARHRNSHIYTSLQGLVEFDGFYLESDPCLVCNNPEVAYTSAKLASLKSDMKFTTTCQLVKLSGSYNISKFVARISDVRRTKMVRTINLYYSNRTVQSVIELKNKRSLWKQGKSCRLSPGQNDLKVDFPLPIVACNFVIEFADFYDNYQASAETLQCPRCSAQVNANPGICGNCGENVFQCHKCRSINYDEKDPFLCISCGYCKFARFDFAVTSRPCCAVDPIENEDDRQKANSTINSLLERADKVYKQLVTNREPLDVLLSEVGESSGEVERTVDLETGIQTSSSAAAAKAGVNKIIQVVARRYCVDCRSSFEALSKIMQKVLASRKEIIEYDHQQLERAYNQPSSSSSSRPSTPATTPSTPPTPVVDQSPSNFLASAQSRLAQLSQSAGATAKPNCYGCMSAATEHCVALLRALALQPKMREMLIQQGLVRELVDFNLRRGSVAMRREVRALLCLLTRDNPSATRRLNRILLRRVKAALDQHESNPSLVVSIQHEMRLLMSTISTRDSCWELRLRSVFKLFVVSNACTNPVVMEHITLPCLRVLLHVMKLPNDAADRIKERKLSSARIDTGAVADATRWLKGDSRHRFVAWKKRIESGGSAEIANEERLAERFGKRWMLAVLRRKDERSQLNAQNWLRRILFSPSSKTARQVSCAIVEILCKEDDRRQRILDLLSGCLVDFSEAGQNGEEFLWLYQTLSEPERWKKYLAVKGILPLLGRLITNEIKQLAELEQRTLSSDLSQGCALKMLTELLVSFVQHAQIRQRFKSRLVGTILNGFLSLKRLVVQRTKLIDDTQALLLQLLGDMTSGTEEETKAFVAVCVDTLNECPLNDVMTPVFIFERLCDIINPEEDDASEFYLILEKDPAQEEFLQGRMQGNPYSSKDTGMGPSMRDIKNRICTDCELVALLEDDTGMELLVKNKIMSLDLPVKEVFRRIWCKDGDGQEKPMRVVYRMRGLMGEATEDMINSFDNEDQAKDDEEVYGMSAVLSDCGGLDAMLRRLSNLGSIIHGKQLITALLKLLSYCVKVKTNREYLSRPGLNSLNIMLTALNKALRLERDVNDGSGAAIAEQLLLIIEAVLLEASALATSQGVAQEMPTLSEEQAHLTMLLDFIESPYVKSNASVLQAMVRLIPFLTYGDESRMQTLLDHFSPHLDFDRFDKDQGPDNKLYLDCFCNIADGIVSNAHGAQLKDLICEMGIVDSAIQYVVNMPPRPASGTKSADDKPFLDFLARPSLPYVLRILTGLCKGHHKTQLAIGGSALPSIHRLEQVSTEGSVGTLAENLIDALRDNSEVVAKIDDVRRQTRAEKKRLAMAMRQKQLGALGMAVNEKGLLVPSTQIEGEIEALVEETGLKCCICREGYKNHPKKALGIYTFTKRAIIDEFENKARKTQGCSTVSHFNVVHYDCHYSAIKHSRSRDEWESAFLYNANTKCNGLMPIWGPEVSESLYVSNLARYSSNMAECTGLHDLSFLSVVRDLRLLLLRFARELPFSAESGGGGRDSNIHFVPYLISTALYRVSSARGGLNIDKQIAGFLETPKEKWIQGCYEVDGPLECVVLSLFAYASKEWKPLRTKFLRRLIVLAHVRHIFPTPPEKFASPAVAEYTVYKPVLMLFGLIDTIHGHLKPSELGQSISTLCSSWLEWLRRNDQAALAACDKILARYQDEFLPAESFAEFCDVAGLVQETGNADEFLVDSLTFE